jgi:hypothetical protein
MLQAVNLIMAGEPHGQSLYLWTRRVRCPDALMVTDEVQDPALLPE